MSLIPLDERRGDDETTPPESRPQRRGVGDLWDRLRGVMTRVAERLGAGGDTGEAERDSGESGTTTRALPEVSASGETIETLRQQSELVSSETDGTLTVTDAENPDATITSDTFQRVER